MVFIIGHVFGSFSKSLVLRRITRVAAILVIVLFILSNVLAVRFTWNDHRHGMHERGWCHYDSNDSTATHSEYFRESYNP
jgi:hypothetical protein